MTLCAMSKLPFHFSRHDLYTFFHGYHFPGLLVLTNLVANAVGLLSLLTRALFIFSNPLKTRVVADLNVESKMASQSLISQS